MNLLMAMHLNDDLYLNSNSCSGIHLFLNKIAQILVVHQQIMIHVVLFDVSIKGIFMLFSLFDVPRKLVYITLPFPY